MSIDDLAKHLMIAVAELDRDTAHAVVMALQGLGPDGRGRSTDSFRRQLGYRLEQARFRAER